MEDENKKQSDCNLETLLEPVYRNTKVVYFGFLMISSVGTLGALNVFAYQFLGATPDNYYCKVEPLENASWSEDQIKEIAIPYDQKNDSVEYSHCRMKDFNYEILANMTFEDAKTWVSENPTNDTIACKERTFDTTYNTFTTKWDLVCGDLYLYSTAQSAIQSGIIIDSYLLGSISDRFGRRKIFLLSYLMCILSGLLITAVPYFYLFLILRVVLSTFNFAAVNAGLVLCMEMCSIRTRSMLGPFFSLPWAFGIMLLPLMAYYIKNWIYLQLASTAPFIILFLITYFSKSIPESPRWLILNNKYERAYEAIKATAVDKELLLSKESMIYQMKQLTKEDKEEKVPFLKQLLREIKQTVNLFTEKKLRIRTACIQFTWLTASMVYYGVSLGSATINTSEYMFMFLGGLVEFISLLALFPVTLYFGRRKTLFLYFSVSAISILSVFVLQILVSETSFVGLKVVLYLVGKFSMAAAFQLVWVYTSELYPTNLRCLSCGLGSTIAKVGSFASPYINDVLGKEVQWAPAATFGGFSFISAIVILFLPETVKDSLPEDLEN